MMQKLALVSLSLVAWHCCSALGTTAVKTKRDYAARPQQCVYADVSKTGTKTIVCGDPAPATLAAMTAKAARPPAPAPAVDSAPPSPSPSPSPPPPEARTITGKCFDQLCKKKDEYTVVNVQQPAYHQQHYAQPVQYVQQQPQVQYLQPQIQYVQPHVQLVQPQVHVIQQQQPQVHVIQQQPPQVHYVQQQAPQVHYVQQEAPQVQYVQQQQQASYPVKSLCPQGSYYGRSADQQAPVTAVLMADDDSDSYPDESDDSDDSVGVAASAAAPEMRSVPADAVPSYGGAPSEATMARDGLGGPRYLPAFHRPAVAFRYSGGDIAADFQQQMSQQRRQQVQDFGGSVQYAIGGGGGGIGGGGSGFGGGGSGFGGGYSAQQLQPSSYGAARAAGGDVLVRTRTPYGYSVVPGAMSAAQAADPAAAVGQQTMRSADGNGRQDAAAMRSTDAQKKSADGSAAAAAAAVKRVPAAAGQPPMLAAADAKDAVTPAAAAAAAKSAGDRNPMNSYAPMMD